MQKRRKRQTARKSNRSTFLGKRSKRISLWEKANKKVLKETKKRTQLFIQLNQKLAEIDEQKRVLKKAKEAKHRQKRKYLLSECFRHRQKAQDRKAKKLGLIVLSTYCMDEDQLKASFDKAQRKFCKDRLNRIRLQRDLKSSFDVDAG